MKIAIVKPDYRIVGGFEIVVDRIIKGLKKYGHKVDLVKVDMVERRYELGKIHIPEDIYNQNDEFFRYTMSIQAYEKLDLSAYDLVIATQPPSFAVNHPNVVVLFYHHLKIFYDMYEVYMKCIASDEKLHAETAKLIRKIDKQYITNDKFYLAGSQHVANRLKHFNGIKEEQIQVFKAGINDTYFNYKGATSFEYPLCVGRHEFPKRPELFISAMKYLPELQGSLVGTGGRTEDLKIIDAYLQDSYAKGNEVDGEVLWQEVIFKAHELKYAKSNASNVIFKGKIPDKEVMKEYAKALCVICPSYEEDYGLTAIEAMAFGKPVIACSDGGGYAEFIEEGKNGFIVEPTGKAIAEKIKYLKDNPDVLQEMSKNAYESSRKYSWDQVMETFNNAIMKRA